MYKNIVFAFLLIACVNAALCQTGNQNAGTQLANHIADKMRDSLSLSSTQRDQIFSINIDLHNRKMTARSETKNRDSLGILFQQIENKRDSLYGTVLTEQQLLLYKQKKRNLVNSQ